jgi:hypothetical protein
MHKYTNRYIKPKPKESCIFINELLSLGDSYVIGEDTCIEKLIESRGDEEMEIVLDDVLLLLKSIILNFLIWVDELRKAKKDVMVKKTQGKAKV